MASAGLAGTASRQDWARSLARAFCLLVGGGLVLDGTTGLIWGGAEFAVGDDLPHHDWNAFFAFNGWHHALHIVSGAIALVAATRREWAGAGALAFGLIYAVLAPLAIIDGDDALNVVYSPPLDNVVHTTLAVVGIALGIATGTLRRPVQT